MNSLKLKCYSISKCGARHFDNKKPKQDYSGHFSTKEYSIIAVSDGHGGDRYFRSDIGSKIAVEAALKCIKKCLSEVDEENRQVFVNSLLIKNTSENSKTALISRLIESIVSYWNNEVSSLLKKNPFAETELLSLDEDVRIKMMDKNSDYRFKAYGATLIAAVVGAGFWFAFQIGDGTFVIKNNGEYSQPIELDERCVGQYTTSICDASAVKLFHYTWGYETPDAIFIATDGLDESFASLNGLYKFYDNVIKNSLENWEENAIELQEYLPELSRKGSRDDISLAWIISYPNNTAL